SLPEAGEPTTEEAPNAGRGRKGSSRGRGRRGKVDGEEGSEPRGRRRGGKKKTDATEETAPSNAPAEKGEPNDDKPPFMNSAERRTTENEPEIEPGGAGGEHFYDPFAPNDRFTDTPTPAADDSKLEEIGEAEEAAEIESASDLMDEN